MSRNTSAGLLGTPAVPRQRAGDKVVGGGVNRVWFMISRAR